MIRSAHIDTFARDNLPAPEQWPEFSFELPEVRYPDRLNCITAFVDDWVAAGQGARDCLISPTERWSYADLAERVNRIANVLTRDLGMVPGNRVLLRGPNSPMMAAAYFAVIKAGAVVVATMPLLRAKEIAFPLTKAEIRLALCDVRLADEMEKARPLAPALQRIVYWGSGCRRQSRSHDEEGRLRALRCLRHGKRRCLPDRLHLGHHRSAQGHDAFPPRHARDLRLVRQICIARRPRRSLHRFAADRVHLRARRPRAVSAAGRRRRHLAGKSLARRSAVGDRRSPRHHLFHGADRLSRHARQSRRTSISLRCAKASPPARRCLPPRSRPGRRRPVSASSTASAPRKCCTSSSAAARKTCGRALPESRSPAMRRV